MLSSAVRLGILGPYAAQRLQVECAPDIGAVLAAADRCESPTSRQTAPILDLLQAGHDRLYSRLFQS